MSTGTSSLLHRSGMLWRGLLAAVFLFVVPAAARADVSRDYSVQVSAVVAADPLRLEFRWPAHAETQSYEVYRRNSGDSLWGMRIALLPGSATLFADGDVEAGQVYEYRFVRTARRDTTEYRGYGYVYAGIEVPPVEHRGTLVLLVERLVEDSLAFELDRLERDLRGDGWLVVRRSAARTDTPPQVRQIVADVYNADPEHVRALLIVGHVPVPYSGNMFPDGHPDHLGAWPADVYYGDVDGVWTDTDVNNDTTSGQRPENANVPGDGKFDQDVLPSDVELMVGRVDMDNLPFFDYSEIELLRRYFDKNHAYRHDRFPVVRRGLIDDNFKVGVVEGFASNGWRNFAAMFGAAAVDSGEFIPGFSPAGDVALTDSFYLWSYGCGAGNFRSAAFVAHARQFAADTITVKTVFTMLFGSYFGDWDSENNFMRSALAANGYMLTSCWAGRPYWHVHHMALGAPIGYGARLSQNNDTAYISNPVFPFVARMVHTALLGDPTLRLHTVAPPSVLTAQVNGEQRRVELAWEPSPKTVAGYHVYRAATPQEPFRRLTDEPLATTTFADTTPVAGQDVRYMVRAVKLETSGSGSYYNLSQGAERAVDIGPTVVNGEPVWIYPNPCEGQCTVEIAGAGTASVEVRDLTGRLFAERMVTVQEEPGRLTLDMGGAAPGVYLLTVRRGDDVVERTFVVR